MAIVWRYLTALLVLAMLVWVVRTWLTRRQQRAVHEVVSLMAKILLLLAFASLCWTWFAQGGNR